MRITRSLLDQIVQHALRDAPDECCGLVGVADGTAVGVYEIDNVHTRSPKVFAFELGGPKYPRAILDIEDAGAEVGAIYHSHTRSAPYPSNTDINYGKDPRRWPGVEWLIVGTDGPEPEVRSYLISQEGTVTEVPVTVVPENDEGPAS